LSAVVVIALLVAGLAMGAIGASLTGNKSFLSEPEIHMPPQKVFLSEAEEGHGVDAPEEGHGGGTVGSGDGFVVTNTLLSSWIVSVLLVMLFYSATRRMALVPRGLQNLMEMAVEALHSFVEGVAGPSNVRRFFPIIATIFLFVMLNAWIGLLPIYPSLGFLGDNGEIQRHLLRPAGTDLNMTLALALTSFVFVEFWGFRLLGRHYVGKFLRLENLRRGNFLQVPIDLFVGALELLSEFVRIISFTFRLFGNMTAGEILILVVTFLVPFVALLPFYGLELLVGFVQALIFAGLTLVFVVVAVTPHGEEEHS
ncbi:MAG: F0F1 ATP synthase subunit A, partial [Chloroflexi bacterium]|nr:F0F1 ATP synthase subunit A [Chloroflexota bacterium]